MKKLSDNLLNRNYALCKECDEYFEDDIFTHISVLCPNGCGEIVERGVKPKSIKYKSGHNLNERIDIIDRP